MNFKNFIMISEQFQIQKYAQKKSSDGYYFGLKVGRKRVGHVGGIEKNTYERDEKNELMPVHYFDVLNVSLDADQRGQGFFQPALQQIANMFPNGIRSLKVQTSRAFEKAMRKMPTYRDGGDDLIVSPSHT
jgi:hypothetical protein